MGDINIQPRERMRSEKMCTVVGEGDREFSKDEHAGRATVSGQQGEHRRRE